MLLRWVLALPLTPWIALLLENIQPHTTWQARRVVSPDEQLQLAAAQEALEKKRQAAQARRSSQAQPTASKKPVSTGKRSHSSTKRSSQTHAALASQLAALEEAERQAAEHRNAERTRSVLSQMAQQATTPPPKGATNASVSPPEAPAYNWDEGEGTVTDS